MSIENRSPQSLEPQRGDMCKTFPLACPVHSVKVILKSTINDLKCVAVAYMLNATRYAY